jgi:D-aspartate ligase
MKSLSVLVLGAHNDLSIPVMRCLAEVPGVAIHVLSVLRWVPSRFSRHLASFQVLDIGKGTDRQLEIVRDAVRHRGIDVMLPVAEGAIRFVASRREAFRFCAVTPTPELQPFDVVRNKWGLAQFAADHKIPAPCTSLLQAESDLDRLAIDLKFPVLCKPIDASNGSGIVFCAGRDALVRFAQSRIARESPYIVQEFVHGFDIDCSVLCEGGRILAYTVQRGFLSNRKQFAPPVGIEFVEEEKTLGVVADLMGELNWTGVAHVDLRFDMGENVPKVVDVNARYWRSLLGSLVAGVNFPHLACRTALGETYPVPKYRHSRFISKPLPALQHLLRMPWRASDVSVCFAETNFPFTLSDPLPDLLRKIRNLYVGRS